MRLAIALALLPSLAIADPITDRCVEAHHSAQTQRRDGHLTTAKSELTTCARAGCPELIAADCQRWLGEVETLIPIVTVIAHDARGPVTAAIFVDDVAITGPTALDPGTHQFRAEAPGRIIETTTIAVAHTATIDLTLRDVEVPHHFARDVLGGVAIVGLGVAAGFGIAGLSERGHLDDQHCSPNCAPTDVSTIRRNFAVADIALGVGVIAIATIVIRYALDKPAAPAELLTYRF